MSCLKDDTIQAYLDGELTATEKAATEIHLAACDACRARCRRQQETLTALWTDMSKLDPSAVEIPDWSSVLETRNQQAPARVTSGHRPVESRITWLQCLIGIAAAAAIWFVFFPTHRVTLPADRGLESLQTQLPPVGEDPQRMWREQCLVITVTDKTTGSVERFITSSTSDRVVRESFEPNHNDTDDSSILRRGI
jgi:hypothetical protein